MNKFRELIDEEIRRDTARKEELGYEQTFRREGGHTIGDLIRTVMKIDDEETARQFYESYVGYMNNQPGLDPMGAEAMVQCNIGYCFGEGMKPELVVMWRGVCGATHRVSG